MEHFEEPKLTRGGGELLNTRYLHKATHSISDTRNREARGQKNGKRIWSRHGEGGTDACGIHFCLSYLDDTELCTLYTTVLIYKNCTPQQCHPKRFVARRSERPLSLISRVVPLHTVIVQHYQYASLTKGYIRRHQPNNTACRVCQATRSLTHISYVVR